MTLLFAIVTIIPVVPCDRLLDGKVIVSITRLNALIGVVKDRRAITRPGLARTDRAAPDQEEDWW
jgi:hypothetical protein